MIEDGLKEKFEKYLEKPSKDYLKALVKDLVTYRKIHPPCPKCNTDDVIKFGKNPRKDGMVQQYKCKACGHMYTTSSLKSRKRRENYPLCLDCGSEVIRHGSWSWTRKDGTIMKKTKYHCKSCGRFFCVKKGRWG